MADRTFASLVPRLNPSVPGCPQQTMLQYIRDAAIRACERSLMWRYQVPMFNLLPGVHEYPYNKPMSADVHVLFEALMNDEPLQRLTLEQAIVQFPKWADLYSGEDPSVVWSLTPPGVFNGQQYNEQLFNGGSGYVLPDSIVADGAQPQVVCQVNPDKFIVLPLPDAERTYRMRMFVALKPKRTATGMDEVAFGELEDVILHGALQHLLVLPNVHWSDRELAAYHAKQYTFHLAERRARANLGNMRGTLMARYPGFGV